MTKDDSNLAANAICHAAAMVQESWRQASYEVCRPCVLFKPKLYKDGDQWCALFGDNLQEGVSGFGNTPADAMYDFDRNWSKP